MVARRMAQDAGIPLIRDAVPADAPAIDAVVHEGFTSYRGWAGAAFRVPGPEAAGWPVLVGGPSPEDRCWVAVAAAGAGTVAGVARTATRSKAIPAVEAGGVILRNLFVARPWWGRGVADRLLDRALAAARADGYVTVWLAAAAGAEQAQRFYARRGFTERSRHHEAGVGLDVVVCAREL
jgi:GNAT superfamily N-acetyltransferase